LIDVTRERVAPFLEIPVNELRPSQHNGIRSLAVSLENLGIAQREQARVDCLTPLLEAYSLCHHLRDRTTGAGVCFNIAQVYHSKLPLRDLDESEKWLERALQLTDSNNLHHQGKCLNELGLVALEKGRDAIDLSRDDGGDGANRLLNEAEHLALEALKRLPAHALHDRAVSYATLADIEMWAANIPQAVEHLNESIRLHESVEAFDGADDVRINAAVAFALRGRFVEAMEFAGAAHRELTRLRVLPADLERVEQLIRFIEKMRREHTGDQGDESR